MLFSISIGSKGDNDPYFSVYVPMFWSPGNQLIIDDEPITDFLGNHKCVLERHHYLYSLKIEGIDSIQECMRIIDDVKVAINWISLKRTVGIKVPENTTEINLYKVPIKISENSDFQFITNRMGWDELDGDYYADQLVLIPEHKKLARWEMGKAGILLKQNPSQFFEDLNEGMKLENISEIIENKKLRLAVDLFSAYKFEVTTTSKFVKLVTVLEALLPEGQISGSSLKALETAKASIKEYRSNVKKVGEDASEINHLLSRLGNLKSKPIGTNLVEYVRNVLDKNPELGECDVLLPKIKEIYDARSTLLHSGEYDSFTLEEYTRILSQLVPGILKTYFKAP